MKKTKKVDVSRRSEAKTEAKHERAESSLEKLFERVTKDSDPTSPRLRRAGKYSFAQFKAGMKVEGGEHADVTKGSPLKTAKIVMAHLKEVPNYYTKLKKVEKK